MAGSAFTDEKVLAALKDVVPVYVEQGVDDAAIRQYRVRGYPTVALLDAEGNEVDRAEGVLSADALAQSLKRITSP